LFANVNVCSFLHAALWFNQQQGCQIYFLPRGKI